MIVLLATIILGVALSAMIIGLKGTAQSVTDQTTAKIATELGINE
jgi:hypothetical protein